MNKSKVRVGIVVALGALLSVGVLSGFANAQTQVVSQTPSAQNTPAAPHPVKLAGDVIAVSGSSITLSTVKGDYTVNISAETWIVVQKNGAPTEGTIADIVTRKLARVAGMTTAAPDVVDARLVAQGTFDNGRGWSVLDRVAARARLAIARHAASGTITSINGNTVTLKGVVVPAVTVQTTADTVIFDNGFAGISSLKVGDSVQVLGKPVKSSSGQGQPSATPGSRTIDAWAIRVDTGTSQMKVGRVTAINGNALTVRTPANRKGITVDVAPSTGFKIISVANKSISVANASLSDVKVGSVVILEATSASGGQSLNADAVLVVQGKAK